MGGCAQRAMRIKYQANSVIGVEHRPFQSAITAMWKTMSRTFDHLRNGTFFGALSRKARGYRNHWRRSRWSARTQCAEVQLNIQSGVKLNLCYGDELSRIIYCEDFEWQERQFLNRFLRPGDVYADVGSNIGLFTVIAARRVGTAGHVHSIEPCKTTFERLQANVGLNNLRNVTCRQVALSDEPGTREILTSLDGYAAWNSFAQPIEGQAFASESVPCTTWDEYARVNNLVGRVTMIKIDVEGWESRVLRGAKETLGRGDGPVLQVEFTEKASRAAGSSCKELYRMLEQYGYHMFLYDGLSRKLLHEPIRENYFHLNVIACKSIQQLATRLGKISAFRL